MDNRLFNVNGRGKEALKMVLDLAMVQAHGFYPDHNDPDRAMNRGHVTHWLVTPKRGLVLFMYEPSTAKGKAQAFLTPLKLDACVEVVWAWLENDETWKNNIFYTDEEEKGKIGRDSCEDQLCNSHWDEDADHDGDNSRGWRAYVEAWGHVDDHWGAVCAIKPAYMWHGK